jgi:hypothetical protein
MSKYQWTLCKKQRSKFIMNSIITDNGTHFYQYMGHVQNFMHFLMLRRILGDGAFVPSNLAKDLIHRNTVNEYRIATEEELKLVTPLGTQIAS